MSSIEWPANDYAIGSYIQSYVANELLPQFTPAPTDVILDVGCGDGSFSTTILAKVPQGKVVGVDRSLNMLELAKEKIKQFPNFSIQQADVLSLNFEQVFNDVVSFWCLQWCNDIQLAFKNFFNALKKGGTVFTIFPAGDDPYINMYRALKNRGKIPQLEHFKPPVDYTRLDNLEQKLSTIPFSALHVKKISKAITLPSLDTYRKFVNGIAFYQGQIPEPDIQLINEAMVELFNEDCQKKYNGEIRFAMTIYLVTGKK